MSLAMALTNAPPLPFRTMVLMLKGFVFLDYLWLMSDTMSLERALARAPPLPFRAMVPFPYLNMLVSAIKNTAGIRRAGSAALDLCYVAAGRLDAFWETGLAPWDLAAGTLIIREAGGIVSGLDGSEDFLDSGHVLTGTPRIYAALAKLFGPDIKTMFAE